jgi:dUTP pyrophosphatase
MVEKAHAVSSESNVYIQFVKLTEHTPTPIRESPRSAGFDLLNPYDTTIPARGKELIRTDLQIKLPEGCYGRIAPRADLAVSSHDVVGVIDEDFCCNLSVLLFNHSANPYNISRGDKIVKLICEIIYYPELDFVGRLDDTWRGTRGFSSTGQN